MKECYKKVGQVSGCKGPVINHGMGAGGGGLQNEKGGGASQVLPLQRVGGRKSFSHAEGGGAQVLR